MDDCEICLGRDGDAVGTATFELDDPNEEPTEVRMCRTCLDSICDLMLRRYQNVVADCSAEVAAMCEILGITLPETKL